MTDLDGRVAIVTGAGIGLGRAEALELATLGARVVVNDLGVSLDGSPDVNRADDVAAEIRARGGEAVAHHGDVADFTEAQKLVALAVEHWGQLDILVNNAGFLRDRMLFNMSESEWDAVVRTHLKGHFCTSRWAASYWREQSKSSGGSVYGRIVNTASEAALLASEGQPNYAAAKAGIIALTMVSANSLQRFGVTANVIAPRALTRMTASTPGFDAMDGDIAAFAPEHVSPLVAWLASPAAAHVTGQLFVLWGKQISVIAAPTVGCRFEAGDRWTVDAVDEQLRPFFAADNEIGFTFRYSS